MPDKNEQLRGYKERERFWHNQAITQLSLSINFTSVITVAALGFLLKNDDAHPIHLKIDLNVCPCEDHSKGLLFLLAVLSLLMSIIYGFTAMLARNQDMRMTRHINMTRRRYFERYVKSIKGENTSKIEGAIYLITKKFYHFKETDYCSPAFPNEFEKLRKQSEKLGNYTWEYHKGQILFLIVSLVFYIVSVFITV